MKKVLSVVLAMALILVQAVIPAFAVDEGNESLYKAIEISGENELFVKFIGVDEKDTYSVKLVNLLGLKNYGGSMDIIAVGDDGKRYTGVYYYDYNAEEGLVSLDKNISVEFDGIKSNTLTVNRWLQARVLMESAMLRSFMYAVSSEDVYGASFNGYNAQSEELDVDAMTAIAIMMCDSDVKGKDDNFIYHEMDIATTEDCIYAVFGAQDIDASTSIFYNQENSIVEFKEPRSLEYDYKAEAMTYADGKWTMNAEIFTADNSKEKYAEITVVMNQDYIIDAIDYEIALFGDANGDGVVNTLDARRILQYVAELVDEDQICLENADVNGDGVVTTLDARFVLQMVAGLK